MASGPVQNETGWESGRVIYRMEEFMFCSSVYIIGWWNHGVR